MSGAVGEYTEKVLTIPRTITILICVVMIRLVLFTLAKGVKKTQLTDAPCVFVHWAQQMHLTRLYLTFELDTAEETEFELGRHRGRRNRRMTPLCAQTDDAAWRYVDNTAIQESYPA